MFKAKRSLVIFIIVFSFGQCFSIDHVFALTENEGVSDIENIKPPPRDIKDILRVLEQTKQDQSQLDKAKKVLALPIPTSNDLVVLNNYYYRKAYAAEIVGDSKSAADYLNKVVTEYPSSDPQFALDELVVYATVLASRGNRISAISYLEKAKEKVTNNNRGRLVTIERGIASDCLAIGDFDCAKAALIRLETNYKNMLNRPNAGNVRQEYKLIWEASFEWIRSSIFRMEGKYFEAERGLRRALKLNADILALIKEAGRDAIDNEARIVQDATSSTRAIYGQRINLLNELSAVYLGQGRLIDAEYWAREAVVLAINRVGVDSALTTKSLLQLTKVVSEQGRSSEAVLLANAALKSAQKSTDFAGSPLIADSRKTLGGALVADGKYLQGEKVFSEMVAGIQTDPQIAVRYKTGDLNWVQALIKTGDSSKAVEMTSRMLANASAQMEKNSPRLAMIRAFNASALQASGQHEKSLSEFKASIPILIEQARNDTENAQEGARQSQRMSFVLEGYLVSLAQQAKMDSSGSAAAEAFQVADLARGSGVQRALTASAARASITDPQLAALARKEQDLQQRINTLSGLLTGLLSAPPEQQLPAVQAKIRTDLTSFNAERESLKKEIERKYPDYAELVEPKPATVERTQKALKSDEVLVSWYFGENVGYVWAITKDGPAQYAQLSIGRSQMAKEVTQLRKALDPGVATIDEIPPFDVVLANQLYQQILLPIEGGLKGKKVVLTIPHAELGQLPLSLLVTKAVQQPAKGGVIFESYKSVPWLTREIAVAQLPSVTALTALRGLPPSNSSRKSFIGFGDPYFSAQQEKAADKKAKATQLATRGVPLNLRSAPKMNGVSSAELALLPRLPDTSNEIEEIGKAVGAGEGDIFLHQNASVRQVMTADLSNRKVVMFATHGLVPGELNGLTQPALALSSPEVTGDKDDGLLTMDKVLTLKLDADWVVLSACNTASGEGAGSEAVSGLGRAFFYAGAKALLVSNWPVDSVASRAMMTDLFKRQQQEQGVSKAELLRQAMLDQIDQGGMKEGSSMKYSYAHPLFWAPFVVVGD